MALRAFKAETIKQANEQIEVGGETKIDTKVQRGLKERQTKVLHLFQNWDKPFWNERSTMPSLILSFFKISFSQNFKPQRIHSIGFLWLKESSKVLGKSSFVLFGHWRRWENRWKLELNVKQIWNHSIPNMPWSSCFLGLWWVEVTLTWFGKCSPPR